jgi:hypothetical protein
VNLARFRGQSLAGLIGYATTALLLFGGCVFGPTAQQREEQARIADAKYQKQQRKKWLKAKEKWAEQAEKMQVRANPSAPIESWRALLLVKGYPVGISPIPSVQDVVGALGPPAKRMTSRDTRGGRVNAIYDVWHYPNYKAVNTVTGETRGINIVWQSILGQYYIINVELAE